MSEQKVCELLVTWGHDLHALLRSGLDGQKHCPTLGCRLFKGCWLGGSNGGSLSIGWVTIV